MPISKVNDPFRDSHGLWTGDTNQGVAVEFPCRAAYLGLPHIDEESQVFRHSTGQGSPGRRDSWMKERDGFAFGSQ